MLHKCFGTLPQICASTQSCLGCSTDNSFDLMAWFLLWHKLSAVGPYIDGCVPFQIMSNHLNLPQVDSNQVVERMINGNRMQLRSISCLIAKGLNTHVNKVFLFFICTKCGTFIKHLANFVFAFSLWGVVSKLLSNCFLFKNVRMTCNVTKCEKCQSVWILSKGTVYQVWVQM
jgi:hypothetical protein